MMSDFYKRKFLNGFNPEAPSNDTMSAISKVSTNSTSRLNSGTRNKQLTDLTLEQLEFVAFEFKNSNKLHKLLSQMLFFIKLSDDLEARFINRIEYKELFKECFGYNYSTEPTNSTDTPMVQPTATEPTVTDDKVEEWNTTNGSNSKQKRSINITKSATDDIPVEPADAPTPDDDMVQSDSVKSPETFKPTKAEDLSPCPSCNKTMNSSNECKNTDCKNYAEDADEEWV